MTLGVLCPGQGAQDPSMLDIASSHPKGRAILQLLEPVLRTSVHEYANAVAQPLVCATQLATWAVLEPRLPQDRVFAGYSIGELAAHGCAGALQPDKLIDLACARAQAMDASCLAPCRMTAVRDVTYTALNRLAQATAVYVAIVNEPDRFVVAGLSVHMDEFEAAARAHGAGLRRLPVAIASHTPLMSNASASMRRHLLRSPLVAPRFRVLAGVDGQCVISRERAIDTLCAQIATTIDWAACMQGLHEAGCTALLELGPGADLTRMARRRFPDIPARSVSEFRTIEGIVAWAHRHSDG